MVDYKEEYPGDSRPETRKHIDKVIELGTKFINKLATRFNGHDASKLVEPERKFFDKATPNLKRTTFGDADYESEKAAIAEGISHHYMANDHHPEHFGDAGISGMNLYQLVEMYIDWMAAGKRHENGNLFNSIHTCKTKYPNRKLGGQLYDILLNTAIVDSPESLATADPEVKEYLASRGTGAPDTQAEA